MVEWGLLAALILGLTVWFMREFRLVQAQGEQAVIRTTVAALRIAMVNEHLRASADGARTVVVKPQNPFLLLARQPPNYLGEISASQPDQLAPGNWFFDPACPCVGYVPLDPQRLTSADGEPALLFRVVGAGPAQLVALQAYWWQGQRLE